MTALLNRGEGAGRCVGAVGSPVCAGLSPQLWLRSPVFARQSLSRAALLSHALTHNLLTPPPPPTHLLIRMERSLSAATAAFQNVGHAHATTTHTHTHA